MAEKQSVGKFKCCKKEMTCYYCISCHAVLHRSCTDRKSITVIKENKIYCSSLCRTFDEDRNNEEIQEIQELRKIIAEQQTEINGLSEHLKRTKRSSIAFEDAAEETEKSYQKQIEENKDIIESLKGKLEESRKLYEEAKINEDTISKKYKREREELRKKTKEASDGLMEEKKAKDKAMKLAEKLKNENAELNKKLEALVNNLGNDTTEDTEKAKLSEFQETIDKLMNTLVVLERSFEEKEARMKIESASHSQNIETLQLQLTKLEDMNTNLQENVRKLEVERKSLVNEMRTCLDGAKSQKYKKPKVLLLDGPSGYNNGKIYKAITQSAYDTNCRYSKSSLFEEILNPLGSLTREFASNDHVIIFSNSENARYGKSIGDQEIHNLMSLVKHTNLIIVGALHLDNKPALNKLVDLQNNQLFNLTGGATFHYVDPNRLIRKRDQRAIDNGQLTNRERYMVLRHVYDHFVRTRTTATMAENSKANDEAFVDMVSHNMPTQENTDYDLGQTHGTTQQNMISVTSNKVEEIRNFSNKTGTTATVKENDEVIVNMVAHSNSTQENTDNDLGQTQGTTLQNTISVTANRVEDAQHLSSKTETIATMTDNPTENDEATTFLYPRLSQITMDM